MNQNQETRIVRAARTSRPSEVVIRFKPAPKQTVCPTKRWNRLLLSALLRKLRELHVQLAVLTEEALARESPEVVLAMFTEKGGDLIDLLQLHKLRIEVQNWRWGRDELSELFFYAAEAVYRLMLAPEDIWHGDDELDFERAFYGSLDVFEWLGPVPEC